MDTTLLSQLFILQLIDKHILLDNQYSLTRFFAKSSILPDELYCTLNDLEQQKFIRVKEIKSTVKYYDVTDAGKQLLKVNYSIANLKTYLHEIEKTDFFTTILQKFEGSNLT